MLIDLLESSKAIGLSPMGKWIRNYLQFYAQNFCSWLLIQNVTVHVHVQTSEAPTACRTLKQPSWHKFELSLQIMKIQCVFVFNITPTAKVI